MGEFRQYKMRSLAEYWYFLLGVPRGRHSLDLRWRASHGAYALDDSVFKQPVQIGNATNWICVASGDEMLVALKADGSAMEMGFGFLVVGRTWPMALPPKPLGIHNDWVAIGRSGMALCHWQVTAACGIGRTWPITAHSWHLQGNDRD